MAIPVLTSEPGDGRYVFVQHDVCGRRHRHWITGSLLLRRPPCGCGGHYLVAVA